MKRCASTLAVQFLILLFSSSTSLAWAQQLLNSAIPVVTAGSTNNTLTADIISLSNERPVLRELIIQSGILATLSSDKPYTFFAPTEAALKELQYESAEKLQPIMQHHIVLGRYALIDLKDGAVLPTLAGDSITVFRKFNAVSINSIPISGSHETTKNIVVHTIDDVLKPKKLD
ncbi:fasciclin domain-containing protein [Adhaeribacter pallidiroseus]|uniref:FAS1 domain-containing protein n=1 Tax=Adhaeribacter pallidiroseus TaxID=2072847 RepID=A0A369QQT4_9BACT|nr:fasciclin domain-containing protein [Adhaeribacter pallidiroseus]RDC65656.1 hypothetical protein AHMF7616_04286 [Adhaeribacter pallidiroseus]